MIIFLEDFNFIFVNHMLQKDSFDETQEGSINNTIINHI